MKQTPNSRALIPYAHSLNKPPFYSRTLTYLSSLSHYAQLHFSCNKHVYVFTLVLFSFGFSISCFWKEINGVSHLSPSTIPLLQLICAISFIFSFGFIGIATIPLLTVLHSFFVGLLFSAAQVQSHSSTILLFITHILTVLFYSEAIVSSKRTHIGPRLFFRTKGTYLFILLFCSLEAFLTLLL